MKGRKTTALNVQHNGGALPGSASYTYDAAGNRLTKTAVQEATPNPVSVLSQYSYDPIYELTQAVVNGSVAESYSYDAVGNRLTSAGPVTYNNNTSNELTSSSVATYTYDNNGNTTSKTTSAGMTSYTWDFENHLASVTLPGTGGTVNLAYDPFGRRIEKVAPTTGTTIYAYDGDNVTEEFGAAGNLLAQYTQGAGIDEPLGISESGGTYYYHADGLGSITSLTNGSGQLANSYVYDSFGNLTASTGTATNPFQYTGREFDSETGLYYYRARYYDPSVGRFVSEDPIRFIEDADFYLYVTNDPTALADPSGLQHSPGGPLHQPPGVKIACTWNDDCSTLSSKIDWFDRIITSHIAWDAAHNTNRHAEDIIQLQNGRANCVAIHQAKCTNKPCPQTNPLTAPSSQGQPITIPAPPPPSAIPAIGAAGAILLLIIIFLSPVGA